MPPHNHEEIVARLAHLVQQINASRPRQPKGPGRPSHGIRSGYIRTEIYLPPDIRDALDQLADRREAQTGRATSRADMAREALAAYVRERLSPARV